LVHFGTKYPFQSENIAFKNRDKKRAELLIFSRKTPLFHGLAVWYRGGWIEGLEQYTPHTINRINKGLSSCFGTFLVQNKKGAAQTVPSLLLLIQFIIKPHQQDHADGEECNKPSHTRLTFMV
jgi:hypothetical protein